VLRKGVPGQVYNIGGGNEVQNLTLTRRILELLGKDDQLIRYVSDRPGHDRRYAIDCTKLNALGWRPQVEFEAGLASTVAWYRDHPEWWRPIKSGEWRQYYARQYGEIG
jgi:dTDP-glucose 4,6-dehydratase